jgi:hypothetical protein
MQHVNRGKEKNHLNISIGDKSSDETKIQRNLSICNKDYIGQHIANIKLIEEKLKPFPLKPPVRQRCFVPFPS